MTKRLTPPLTETEATSALFDQGKTISNVVWLKGTFLKRHGDHIVNERGDSFETFNLPVGSRWVVVEQERRWLKKGDKVVNTHTDTTWQVLLADDELALLRCETTKCKNVVIDLDSWHNGTYPGWTLVEPALLEPKKQKQGRRGRPRVPAAKIASVIEMVSNGMTKKQAANAAGISLSALARALKQRA